MKLESVAKKICKEKELEYVSFIDAGTYKETYQVYKEKFSFALKIFHSGCSKERTKRELDAMMTCCHPNISKLISFGKTDFNNVEHYFILEEFLSGGTLTNKIKTSQLTKSDVINITFKLIDAISHIASKDLVHRDLKPDNIMFRDSNTSPVIVDFGIVRDLKADSLTHAWQIRGPGTPYYAAPEQLNNEKDLINWRTDQFSLGVLISICMFGIHPYSEKNTPISDVVNRVANKEPVSSLFIDSCNKNGYNALKTMVQPWPISRYKTPSQLFEAWKKEV